MALLKPKTLPTGVIVTYHNIHRMTWLRDGLTQEIILASYLSEADRIDGKDPVSTTSLALYQVTDSLDRAAAYSAIKDTPEFTGATDV